MQLHLFKEFILFYMVFHNCWKKAAASQIFPVDFILFLFLDYFISVQIFACYIQQCL